MFNAFVKKKKNYDEISGYKSRKRSVMKPACGG